MKGVESQAMIMCANNGDKVEIVDPPQGGVAPYDAMSIHAACT